MIPGIWFSKFDLEQGTSEGFNSCDLPCNLTQFFSTWPWIWWMTLKNVVWASTGVRTHTARILSQPSSTQPTAPQEYSGSEAERVWPGANHKNNRHLFYTMSSFVHHFKAISEFKLELQSGNTQFWSKFVIFFVPCDLEILQMTLSYSLETLNSGQNWRFFILCDLEIWQMTLKNNGAPLLYYVKFMHHFKATNEFKLELQSGNTQFGSKLVFFVPCDLEIWQMTLKKNRAPLLCYFKLYASFDSHQWIQTGVTIRKCPIQVKINYFFALCDLEIW